MVVMKNKKTVITIALFIAVVVNSFGTGSDGMSITSFSQNSSPSSFAISWTVLANFEYLALVQSYNVFSVNSSGTRTNLGSIRATNSTANYNNYTLNITLQPCSSYNLQVEAIGGEGADANTPQGYTNVYGYTTTNYNGTPVVVVFSGDMSTFSGTWVANEIDLNPGFSYLPTGINSSNHLDLIATKDKICSGITARNSSVASENISATTSLKPTPESEPVIQQNIQIYPNPTNDKITIDMADVTENTTVNIVNFAGQTIYRSNISDLKTIIDLSSYSQGMYMVNIISNGTSNTVKVVKN